MTESDFKVYGILIGAAIFCAFLGLYEVIARMP